MLARPIYSLSSLFDPNPSPASLTLLWHYPQMDFTDGYFFSSSDAAAYYSPRARVSGCDTATHESICDYVSELPPYTCTRTLPLGKADIIGV